MTQTLDTPTQTPTQRAERWLHDLEEALRGGGGG
jgi:putative flavoprotein involved in K+ transport